MKHIFFILALINIGYAQTYETIPVDTGWNLIGALEDGPIVSIISTTPPGIIISSFFGYNNMYYSEDTLARGKGYWVKVSESGIIQIQLASTGPCNGVSTVYYEGKTYNTIAIGNQCWFRENLDVGTMIMGTQNPTNNGVIEKYCHNNDIANCLIYGGLYQWNEAMQYTTTSGAQGICPSGWHIPTLDEFFVLRNAVGADGNALRSVGQGNGSGAGTNTSGFSALLAGNRHFDGYFTSLGYTAGFWSSIDFNPNAGMMFLYYSNNSIGQGSDRRDWGYNVRCLKD